jgi:hypothetical protein
MGAFHCHFWDQGEFASCQIASLPFLLSFFQDRDAAPSLLQQIRFLPRRSLKLSDLEALFHLTMGL